MTKQEEGFIPLDYRAPSEAEVGKKAAEFYQSMEKRRSVRTFSSQDVPRSVIEDIIMAASTAPSGAHKQPWVFCAISDAEMKKKIREAAEKEEYENYHGRMSDEWLDDLKVFGTDWNKPFLEIAPWLVVIMRKVYDVDDGVKKKNYYVQESVGIAAGMFLTAVHQAGLVSLTHTPSPMNFLAKILERPSNEKPFLLIPIGYPATDTVVPNITRKGLDDVAKFY